MSTSSKFLKSAAIFSMLGLTLAACGDNGDDDANGEDPDENGVEETDDGDNGEAAGGTITLGYVDGWTDGQSTSYLWQVILEEQGYDIEIMDLTDAAPLYQGLADGAIHVYPSAWLPVTHENYMDQHGDDLEDLGHYYEGAVLTLAVPGYTDVDSIADLPDNADLFDGQVIGIEPGSGHMDTTSGTVFPEYGLDEDFELVESSTAAMMATLDDALDNEEDIVVTLWRPFWAYDGERDLKDLEDPEGHLGAEETLNLVANAEFSTEFPEVAEWMSSFELTDDEYAELEDLVVNEYGGIEGAEVWVENNQDLVDELIN
ncbi:glycine betaine ABC transporter substrate-binding protein [Nesterenkonia muleiensis]|uniref:glycine betaine ABC transporter substrate-binding protein n=1 Tax=Nesterenkonia muleiensis TaxID=2282648 RepID=UPI001EE46A72|nr:glycine betaine ABC transporter substrate-binding protein [Nesterenkonia muleiensis]